MEPDSIGTKDQMAVVVSKDSLNWSAVNSQISQNKTVDYASRVRSALGSSTQFIPAELSSKGNIHFKAEAGSKRIVTCIIEINK